MQREYCQQGFKVAAVITQKVAFTQPKMGTAPTKRIRAPGKVRAPG